jgi:hypothetical protein
VKCLKELEEAIKLFTICKAKLYPTYKIEKDNEGAYMKAKPIDNYTLNEQSILEIET